MSIREIDFVDGIVSASDPSNDSLEGSAIEMSEFVDIAAFEAHIGRATETSDIFYNTTTDTGQYYNGTDWIEMSDSTTDLASHVGASIAHGTTGNIVGESDAQSISNKQFTTGNTSQDLTPDGDSTRDIGASGTKYKDIHLSGTVNTGDIQAATMTTSGAVTVGGDLTVDGTTTTVNSETVEVTDASILVNNGGNVASANLGDAGLEIDLSDATNVKIGYDSTLTSKIKVGEAASEAEVVTVSHAQALSNKELEDELTFAEIATPSTPSAGKVAIYPKSDGSFYKMADDGIEAELGGGGGASGSGFNYNENDYASSVGNISSSVPANLQYDIETTTPLLGSGSLSIFKVGGIDNNGAYWELDQFVIEEAHRAAGFEFTFGIKINTGIVADADLRVLIYDDANTTTIEPVPTEIYFSNNFTAQIKINFQTPSNVTTLRPRLYMNSSTLENFTLTLDGYGGDAYYFGPTRGITSGPIDQYLGNLATTGTHTTNVTYTGSYWRKGDILHAEVNVLFSASSDGAYTALNLPSGLVIDTSKLAEATSKNGSIGSGIWDGGSDWDVVGKYVSTTAVQFPYRSSASALANLAGASVGNGDEITVRYSVPILGWSSNQVMGSESSSREIGFNATKNGDQAISGTNTLIDITAWNDASVDTAASFNPTTGEYEIPESGLYSGAFIASIEMGVTATSSIEARITSSTIGRVATYDGGGFTPSTRAMVSLPFTGVRLTKGDKLVVEVSSGDQAVTLKSYAARFYVSKDQSPQQISASEKVYGFANTDGTANGDFVSGSEEQIIYTVVDDSHGAMKPSGIIESPRSGVLSLSANYQYNGSSNWDVDEVSVIYVYVGGVNVLQKFVEMPTGIANTIAISDAISISGITINKDDLIEVRLMQNSADVISLAASSARTTISWEIK